MFAQKYILAMLLLAFVFPTALVGQKQNCPVGSIKPSIANNDFWATVPSNCYKNLTPDSLGNLLLTVAARSANLQVVKKFELSQQTLLFDNVFGANPLLYSVANPDTAVFNYLLSYVGSSQLLTPDLLGKIIETSIVYRNMHALSEAITLAGHVDFRVNEKLETPLMLTAQIGADPMVEWLLAKGANPNITAANQSTACHHAAFNGSVSTIELLAHANADFNVKNNEGMTPLMVAVFNNNFDVVSILVDKGADVNATAFDGFSAMHAAAQQGLLPLIVKLFNAKANVDVKTNNGLTPLMLAAHHGYNKVVEYLLSTGQVKVNELNIDGKSALLYATMQDNIETMELLLEAGANPNLKNVSGRKPITYAISEDAKKMLLKYENSPKFFNFIYVEPESLTVEK